jgi:hypothetical protein
MVKFTEEEFTNNIESYIKSLDVKKPPVKEPERENYEMFIKILDFLNKYNIVIFGSIILLSLTGIIVYRKKDSFDLDVK